MYHSGQNKLVQNKPYALSYIKVKYVAYLHTAKDLECILSSDSISVYAYFPVHSKTGLNIPAILDRHYKSERGFANQGFQIKLMKTRRSFLKN